MVIIKFSDSKTECRALGFLAGRFSFKSWDTGETMVPPSALTALAMEGIPFSVVGRANYERWLSSVRDSSSVKV